MKSPALVIVDVPSCEVTGELLLPDGDCKERGGLESEVKGSGSSRVNCLLLVDHLHSLNTLTI